MVKCFYAEDNKLDDGTKLPTCKTGETRWLSKLPMFRAVFTHFDEIKYKLGSFIIENHFNELFSEDGKDGLCQEMIIQLHVFLIRS